MNAIAVTPMTPEPPAPAPGLSEQPLDDLITRMRAGDRDAAAAFTQQFGPLIRRRIRGKLGPALRRIFDSQDMLSTLGRRLDRYVRAGRLQAATAPQLWALVFRIADAALIDKVKVARRLRTTESEDAPFAQQFLRKMEDGAARSPDGADAQIDRALSLLEEPSDRQILALWLMDNTHRVIADQLGISHDTCRKRWQHIRDVLRRKFEEEGR